jgi:3-deoxy-D-manno-octulosonic-acid transferase
VGKAPLNFAHRVVQFFFGPYMSNFSSISEQLSKTSAGFVINSYDEWIIDGLELLSSHQRLIASKKAAREFVSKNKGAAKISAEKIEELI